MSVKKKRLVWILGTGLLLVFVSLISLQYIYYSRIITLRKEQINSKAQLALQELAQDIEVRELVRYLNIELNNSSSPNNTLMEALNEIRQQSQKKELTRVEVDIPRYARDADNAYYKMYFDSLAISDPILHAFIDNRALLDEYILRNLYRVYSYDSIAQLVKPKFLREHLALKLSDYGVDNRFSVSLCNPTGEELFRYTQLGMQVKPVQDSDVVVQRIFANREFPGGLSPFIKLSLDYSSLEDELLSLAFPGIIITLVIVVFGIVAMGFVSRQLMFQVAKTDFINNMTHELKTPVSSILLAVEQIQRIPLPPSVPEDTDCLNKQKRYLSIVEDEAQRLRMLIDKVLQIALFDKDKKLITLNEINLDEIILKAAKLFSIHTAKYGGELTLELDAYNAWVMASETHMTNVLYNLLENAIKYRVEGRRPEILLRSYNTELGDLKILVEDNGQGIPEGETKRIFERFYRVSTGLTHNVKGYGLGLAYVHSIITQMGGTIVAQNKPTGGLRMEITLPTLTEGGIE